MYAEIGEIIAGKKDAPVDKITIFDSMGMLTIFLGMKIVVCDRLISWENVVDYFILGNNLLLLFVM